MTLWLRRGMRDMLVSLSKFLIFGLSMSLELPASLRIYYYHFLLEMSSIGQRTIQYSTLATLLSIKLHLPY
ncbi:hypothetical protein GGR58DRAFT_491833 [Xylaria digitata]|nr:hypothetical protein GGR58DRAFT_491833 [Xylaria digitata]